MSYSIAANCAEWELEFAAVEDFVVASPSEMSYLRTREGLKEFRFDTELS